jgi:hypothetical protein
VRKFLSLSWLVRHLLAIFLIGLFVRLGWWQLVKGQSDRGTLQNMFYGLEWPIFAAAVAFFWWRMVRDELRPPDPDKPEPVRAAPPLPSTAAAGGAQPDDEDEEDIELAAYNRYLAALHESDK